MSDNCLGNQSREMATDTFEEVAYQLSSRRLSGRQRASERARVTLIGDLFRAESFASRTPFLSIKHVQGRNYEQPVNDSNKK